VRESRLPGSAWGVRSNPHPYHDHRLKGCSDWGIIFRGMREPASYCRRALEIAGCFRVAALTFDGSVIGKTSRIYSASAPRKLAA
jgi:hypothetical protein